MHRKIVEDNYELKSKNSKNTYEILEINKNNNEVKKTQKHSKIRNPGIDLGRILAMSAVVIQHINVMSAMKKYGKLKELNIIYAAFNWHISCFTFISGYVGYKTAKYSNLLYLWITTFFYSMGINIIFTLFIPKVYKHKFTLMDYFPVLSFKYWYFTEYFGMYLFLPVINKGIEYITKSQLKATIFSFIVVYVILQDYINPNFDCFKLQNGNSVLWLLIFYITGSYFGKYKKENNSCINFIYCIIYIFIYCFSTYLSIKLQNYSINPNYQSFKDKFIIFLKLLFIVKNASILEVLQSVSIILFLTSIKYNKYFGKIISIIGSSTYAVYIIHCHKIILDNYIRKIFQDKPYNLTINTIIRIIFLSSLKVFLSCTIIDYLRNILFRLCHIKDFCIFIERLFLKLFN